MYQNLVIVGNLGRDPEMKYTASGTAITTMSVGTNRKYTGSDGEQVKETTWFRVAVFGKQAEACAQYLKKGNPVLVEGRLSPDPATGSPKIWAKQDGTAATSFEVIATTVRFLGTGSADGAKAPVAAPAAKAKAQPKQQALPEEEDNSQETDDNPFA